MSTFDSLNDTFDVSAEIVKVEEEPTTKPIKRNKKPLIISDKGEDKEKDYQYARAQIYDIVEKMQESLNGALEVAQQSDHPRAYEVVFQGAKHTADAVEKLQDLHKKMADVESEVEKAQVNQTQNNIYMSGSTADLIKMLKENK
jgi:hypothetical protein